LKVGAVDGVWEDPRFCADAEIEYVSVLSAEASQLSEKLTGIIRSLGLHTKFDTREMERICHIRLKLMRRKVRRK
jgi:hypothetical protein